MVGTTNRKLTILLQKPIFKEYTYSLKNIHIPQKAK